MAINIALAGNPNSGKTTMFNHLTGSMQYVGNWPGVTVEKKEGKVKGMSDAVLQDLPGIYSLSPYTSEEVVSRNYLVKDNPDVIINIVDASSIERNLYLTTQLAEIGIPMVIALNMIDVVRRNKDSIDLEMLSKAIGCEVIETSATKGEGGKEAVEKALAAVKAKKSPNICKFSVEVEKALSDIESLIQDKVQAAAVRWYVIKLFERDAEVLKEMALTNQERELLEDIIIPLEKKYDDDSVSIIIGERYSYIEKLTAKCLKSKKKGKFSASDKIDSIVTNRILALPIFALVMFFVYYIAISSVGTMLTDWVNDGVFGEGFHLFGIGATEYSDLAIEFDEAQLKINAFTSAAQENGIDTEPVLAALNFDGEEYENANELALAEAQAHTAISNFILASQVEGFLQGSADVINSDGELQNLTVTLNEFKDAINVAEPDPAEYGVWVPGIPVLLENGLDAIECNIVLKSLILDGIVAGVGGVLGFLPQMMVLFICLAILEDCGYMSRIAFILDRIFRKFGLSGKSFIPILVGTGCGVPGIMASRTIESEKDRRMTVITTTFIPCGAKLPIIALISGALFGGSSLIAASSYFLGIAAIIISGVMLKKTKMFAGDATPFVMELPAYHLPLFMGVIRNMWDKSKSFVKKAGTIILISSVIIWFLQSFNWSFNMVDDSEASILASIGNFIAPLFAPLGWGNWQSAVATITGLVAKENVVGTMGVIYGFGEVAENGREFWEQLAISFTQISAYSFLVFNLLCAPCFAAIGAVRREMMSAKWTWFAIGYQTVFAYAIALMVYQFGTLFTGGSFGAGTIFATLTLAAMIFLIFKKPYNDKGAPIAPSKHRVKQTV